MEDPWSSPWASTPASEPRPAFHVPSNERHNGPAAQEEVDNGLSFLEPPSEAYSSSTPRRSVPSSPGWGGSDAGEWGGWNDALKGPAWGEDIRREDTWRIESWPTGESELAKQDDMANRTVRNGKRAVDSGISFGPVGDLPTQQNALESTAEAIWSRPSPLLEPTTPAVQVVQHQEAAADSPWPELVRKSSKVQELVNMYDGISRRSLSPASPASSTRAQIPRTLSAGDGKAAEEHREFAKDDTGLIESVAEVHAAHEPHDVEFQTKRLDEQVQEQMAPGGTASDKTVLEVNEDQNQHPGETASESATLYGSPIEDPPRTQQVVSIPSGDDRSTEFSVDQSPALTDGSQTERKSLSKKETGSQSGISYPIDLAHLDTLFPSTEASFPPPERLPDSPLTDSFSTVDQRKVWYRISRFGSLQRHNHADDDTYVRTKWNGSQISNDTLKIVRRWMEEDAFDGKARLGRNRGVAGGTHMFGWDSTAPEVGIGELLAKKGGRTSRGASLTIKAPKLASFGWGSAPSPTLTDSPVEVMARMSGFAISPRENRRHSEQQAAPKPNGNSNAPIPQPKFGDRSSISTRPSTEDFGGQEEDDDWGEMVTSPSVATPQDPFPPDDMMAVTFASPAQAQASLPPFDQDFGIESWSKPSLDGLTPRPTSLGQAVPKAPAPKDDPWAFGDIAMLDKVPQKSAISASPPPPPAPKALPPIIPIGFSMEPLQPMLSPDTPQFSKSATPVPLTSAVVNPHSSEPVLAQDVDHVSRIINSLPDLSYMLR